VKFMSDSVDLTVSGALPADRTLKGLVGAQGVFAATLLVFGIAGLLTGDYTAIWQPPVPDGLPGRELLAYVCAGVVLASGAGLLWPRAAPHAARLLTAWLVLWMIVADGRIILLGPAHEVTYQNWGETAVLVAAAWALYARLAPEGDRRWLRSVTGESGLRIARVLHALALIAFGLSHFVYLENTAGLVQPWLLAPVGWSYFTGATYLAAGAALLFGFWARLAASLVAWQMALITILVWIPLAAAGRLTAFQEGEFALSWALTAAAWVVADSFRNMRRPDARGAGAV
jgi:uncharacterized membrane protein YphA (DoxX/SURF4 family)